MVYHSGEEKVSAERWNYSVLPEDRSYERLRGEGSHKVILQGEKVLIR